MANDESQALLHLAAALMNQSEAIPAFTGAEPFFHAEYGNSAGRVYDSADIYGKTRQFQDQDHARTPPRHDAHRVRRAGG